MRILLANSTAYPTIGGVENSLRYIGRELLRAGHEVKIFCFQTSADQPLRMEHEGIEVLRCPYTPSRWPHVRMRQQVEQVRREIPSVLSEFQPDTVWSRSPCVGLGVIRAGYGGRLLHILPVTARLNADSLLLRTKGLPWRRRLLLLGLWPLQYFCAASIERELLHNSQPVVFSENMRQAVLRSYGKQTYDRTAKIYPGVDADVFAPECGKRLFHEIQNKYGITADERSILFVGRLSVMKNLYVLLDAVARLNNTSRLVLVGSGPEEERLRDVVQRRGLTRKVVFVGRQSELLPGFYSAARVFVNPSFIEPFGQTLLEAHACATPVVGYGDNRRRFCTATQEIVRDGETGAVVKEVNPSALADKIDSILSLDNAAYTAMSQRAREDVRRRFSWARFVHVVLKLSGTEASNERCESLRVL